MDTALCFDDVLLVPKKFNLNSRSEVDLSVDFCGLKLQIPIMSANMPSVTEKNMALRMAMLGGLGIVHRLCSIDEEAKMVQHVKDTLKHFGKKDGKVGASIGIDGDWEQRLNTLLEAGADLICIDVAHAHQQKLIPILNTISSKLYGNFTPFMIGNIATAQAGEWIESNYTGYYRNKSTSEAKSSLSLKVGIGSGASCSTRIQTGCGLPTLHSVFDCRSSKTLLRKNVPLVADGGIKNSGDIVKALASGASAVMLGSLLAGTDEAPGEVIKNGKDGGLYKIYRGNASYGSKKNSGQNTGHIEGVEMLVPYKGSLEQQIKNLLDGVKSGFSYCGASNLSELHENSEFVKITQAGQKESFPHGLL